MPKTPRENLLEIYKPETKKEEDVLEKCGLSKNEAKVFVTLLKLGSASVGEITEDSGIHRRNVYDALERLMKKGLVGKFKKENKTLFEAVNPKRLLDLVKEKREKISLLEMQLKVALQKFLSIRNFSQEKGDVKIYVGPQSRRIIFEDILENSKENMVLGAHTPSKLSRGYLKVWHKRRIKAGIKDRLIYCKPEPYAEELSKLPLTEVRFLPKKIKTTTVVNIYDNKVAIFLWSKDIPVSILIDNKKVAQDFKQYFNFLWKISKKSVH
ncbi:MAG: helix-turn-helix domain-containing protein [Candidatus Aenigmatarchaeota archaeon]